MQPKVDKKSADGSPVDREKRVANPEFEKKSGRQCISPVVLYRKCTQSTIRVFYMERTTCWKKILRPIGAAAPLPPSLWIRHCAEHKIWLCCAELGVRAGLAGNQRQRQSTRGSLIVLADGGRSYAFVLRPRSFLLARRKAFRRSTWTALKYLAMMTAWRLATQKTEWQRQTQTDTEKDEERHGEWGRGAVALSVCVEPSWRENRTRSEISLVQFIILISVSVVATRSSVLVAVIPISQSNKFK